MHMPIWCQLPSLLHLCRTAPCYMTVLPGSYIPLPPVSHRCFPGTCAPLLPPNFQGTCGLAPSLYLSPNFGWKLQCKIYPRAHSAAFSACFYFSCNEVQLGWLPFLAASFTDPSTLLIFVITAWKQGIVWAGEPSFGQRGPMSKSCCSQCCLWSGVWTGAVNFSSQSVLSI